MTLFIAVNERPSGSVLVRVIETDGRQTQQRDEWLTRALQNATFGAAKAAGQTAVARGWAISGCTYEGRIFRLKHTPDPSLPDPSMRITELPEDLAEIDGFLYYAAERCEPILIGVPHS